MSPDPSPQGNDLGAGAEGLANQDVERQLTSIAAAERLERTLTGTLPCIVCRYDLRGVSIRGVCPECGTAIRATILSRVDPRAEELLPIRFRWLVAPGLVLWISATLLAVLACWYAALHQSITNWSIPNPTSGFQEQWGIITGVLIWVAGVGALAICRPHKFIPRWMTICAVFGAILHIPLGLLALRLGHTAAHAVGGWQITTFWEPAPYRTIDRWCAWLLALLIILLVRPVARSLVARSLAIRTGRVDRQTMIAVAAAVAVTFLGDGLGLAAVGSGSPYTGLGIIGAALVLIGSILLTLGLASSLMDATRIARSVLSPGPSMQDILGSAAPPAPTPPPVAATSARLAKGALP